MEPTDVVMMNLSSGIRRRVTLFVILVVLVTAVVVSVGIYLQQASVHYASTPPIFTLVNGNITVGAGSEAIYNFTIPTNAKDSQVTGYFSASGANNGTINVYVMNSTGFSDWQKGQNEGSLYNSGESTSASFDVHLKTNATYFLVYDNSFDRTSSKTVYTIAGFAYLP